MYQEKITNKHLEKLINKGAALKSENDEKKWKFINLRIQDEMLVEIDEVLKNEVGLSRTGWILRVIHKELKSHDN